MQTPWPSSIIKHGRPIFFVVCNRGVACGLAKASSKNHWFWNVQERALHILSDFVSCVLPIFYTGRIYNKLMYIDQHAYFLRADCSVFSAQAPFLVYRWSAWALGVLDSTHWNQHAEGLRITALEGGWKGEEDAGSQPNVNFPPPTGAAQGPSPLGERGQQALGQTPPIREVRLCLHCVHRVHEENSRSSTVDHKIIPPRLGAS